MTVKEVEQLTGMTRANIRYYEMEGLLIPKRNTNGHREYSKSDVEELNKIKLLRTLYISIEEIKELKTNQKRLSEVLETQLEKLEKERRSVVQAMDICRMMKNDQVDFRTFNAGYYYAEYNRMTQNENEVLKKDQIPQERIPVRRLLARGLDTAFYTIIWHAILMVLLNVNLQRLGAIGEVVDVIIVWLLMIVFEGFFVSRYGTTLGKWIFGIEVTNLEDGRLTFTEACVRCVNVFIYGYGCEIPIYGWWKQYKCYEDCSSGVPLKWEEDSCVVLKDKKKWRILAYILVVVIIVGIEAFLSFKVELPPNLGNITSVQFSENYKELAEEKGVLVYDYDPSFSCIVEDGIMKGLFFVGDYSPTLYSEEIQLAMQAFIYAKEPKSVMTSEVQKAFERIMNVQDMESDIFEVCGVQMTIISDGETFCFEMRIAE